jgi:opacity protein-like surface antigen
MKVTSIAAAGLVALFTSAAAAAQSPPWTPEVSIAAGTGYVFRYNDEGYGNHWNAGGGAALVHRSGFAIEFEADRTWGLDPRPTPCGVVGVTCIGAGRDGPTSATVTSIGMQYRLKGERIQPYFTAALGVLWTTSLSSITRVTGSVATITESESSDHGFGPDLGAGVRIAVTKNLAISPEIRWLDAPWLSRQNLAVTRLTIRSSYGW